MSKLIDKMMNLMKIYDEEEYIEEEIEMEEEQPNKIADVRQLRQYSKRNNSRINSTDLKGDYL